MNGDDDDDDGEIIRKFIELKFVKIVLFIEMDSGEGMVYYYFCFPFSPILCVYIHISPNCTYAKWSETK